MRQTRPARRNPKTPANRKPLAPKGLRTSLLSLAAAAALAGVSGLGGGCGTSNIPPPFDPRVIQRQERQGAATARDPIMGPLPDRLNELPKPPSPQRRIPATAPDDGPTDPDRVEPAPREPLVGDEPKRLMTLQEIVQRAVVNSSEVRVAGYEPAIDMTRVVEAEARFDPTFFANIQIQQQFQLTPEQTGGSVNVDPFGSPSEFRTITTQAGVRQDLESGGRVELRYQISRITIASQGAFGQPPEPNPYYVNELALQVTQPLLRDFGNDINRARISIARNNERVSVLEFRRTLEETLAETEQAYWQLVQAVDQVGIQEDLLANTLETYRILETRRETGQDVTVVETAQAQASVESRRAELIGARRQVKDLSDQLKRRMNDPDLPVSDPTIILPASDPLLEPVHFNLQEQIDTALDNRLELGQQLLRIDSATIAARVGRNNLLPQLNLVGQVSILGPGAETGDAFEHQINNANDFVNYAVGLQFEVPFGNRAARAIWRRALLQRAQAIEQYRTLANQVTLDVTTAWREVDTSWDEIVTRRQARFAAAQALRAIYLQQEDIDQLTPSYVRLVLDTEERLANAQLEEAQAVANYNIAISRLERAKGMLLRYNNVLMEEGQYLPEWVE